MSKNSSLALGLGAMFLAPVLIVLGFFIGAIWPVDPGIDSYVPPFLGVLCASPFALFAFVFGIVALVRRATR